MVGFQSRQRTQETIFVQRLEECQTGRLVQLSVTCSLLLVLVSTRGAKL